MEQQHITHFRSGSESSTTWNPGTNDAVNILLLWMSFTLRREMNRDLSIFRDKYRAYEFIEQSVWREPSEHPTDNRFGKFLNLAMPLHWTEADFATVVQDLAKSHLRVRVKSARNVKDQELTSRTQPDV